MIDRVGETADAKERPHTSNIGRMRSSLGGVARNVAASNVTINFLQPGAFDTDRFNSNIENTAKKRGIPFEQAKAERVATIPAKRVGTPEEFGAACAFLCSVHAGYITGQNLLIDGGTFPGAF